MSKATKQQSCLYTITPKVVDFYEISAGNITLKRYRVQWHGWNTKQYYVSRSRIVHAISLDNAKDRALQIFGSIPDSIRRI